MTETKVGKSQENGLFGFIQIPTEFKLAWKIVHFFKKILNWIGVPNTQTSGKNGIRRRFQFGAISSLQFGRKYIPFAIHLEHGMSGGWAALNWKLR